MPSEGQVHIGQEIYMYVVKNLQKLLLGRPAIGDLNLLNRVDSISERSQSILDQFPLVFNNLDKIKQNEAKPFALTTPQRVPIPLVKLVKEELKHMESNGSDISNTRTNKLVCWAWLLHGKRMDKFESV